MAVFQIHATHAACVSTHGAHVVFVKTHGFAAVAEQHHIVCAIRQRCANQKVVVVQTNRDDAAFAWVVEFVQRRLLDRTHAGRHEDELVSGEAGFLTRQG
jgi:hypothetical protein